MKLWLYSTNSRSRRLVYIILWLDHFLSGGCIRTCMLYGINSYELDHQIISTGQSILLSNTQHFFLTAKFDAREHQFQGKNGKSNSNIL